MLGLGLMSVLESAWPILAAAGYQACWLCFGDRSRGNIVRAMRQLWAVGCINGSTRNRVLNRIIGVSSSTASCDCCRAWKTILVRINHRTSLRLVSSTESQELWPRPWSTVLQRTEIEHAVLVDGCPYTYRNGEER